MSITTTDCLDCGKAGARFDRTHACDQADLLAHRRRYPRRARVFGRLILSTCIQSTTRRWIDQCWTNDREGNQYRGWAIHMRPWRRNRHGEILQGPALVVGWRKGPRHA